MLTLHKNSPLTVGGIVFLLVAVMHIVRIATNTHILVGTREIPVGASIAGSLIAGLLGIWLLAATKEK